MEWFGAKMLPRGLPELIYQVTPDWILDDLKVVVLPRQEERGISGRIGWHECLLMRLYPTVILTRVRHDWGVMSFNYWMEFLHTVLHEIGHITDPRSWAAGYGCRYENDNKYKWYIESLADAWKNRIITKIENRDDRMGQPRGWIGGLPGAYLMQRGKWARKIVDGTFGKSDLERVDDIRAYRCGGQLSSTHLIRQFWGEYVPAPLYQAQEYSPKLHSLIKKIAPELGITRHHIDKAGRKHLFFTYGESIQVGEALLRIVKENGLLQHIERERAEEEKIQTNGENLFEFEPPSFVDIEKIYGN